MDHCHVLILNTEVSRNDISKVKVDVRHAAKRTGDFLNDNTQGFLVVA